MQLSCLLGNPYPTQVTSLQDWAHNRHYGLPERHVGGIGHPPLTAKTIRHSLWQSSSNRSSLLCRAASLNDSVPSEGESLKPSRHQFNQDKGYSSPDKIKLPRPSSSAKRPPYQKRKPADSSSTDKNEPSKYPRMSAEDEKAAHIEGHFRQRLIDDGFLDQDGNVTDKGNSIESGTDATYIHLTINKMLAMNRRYQTVLAVVRDVGHLMCPVNVATAMHRLGKLVRNARMRGVEFLPQVLKNPSYTLLLRKTIEVLPETSPRAVSNFMWGMSALGDNVNAPTIIPKLADHLMKSPATKLKTQEVSNVVWSLATLEVYVPDLLDRMLDSAIQRIDDCIPQALSNMTWGCATLRHRHMRFLHTVAENSAPRLYEFGSQTLANTLWAYSVVGIYPTALFHAAADEIVKRFQQAEKENVPGEETQIEFQGQEISNILIAFARGSIIHQGLLQAMENELCRTNWVRQGSELVEKSKLNEFTSQAVANTLWAFASLRWYPARLLPAITEAVGRVVHSMTEQELANSGWAYARFAYHPGRVMASYLQVIEQRVELFDCQSCTNMLWALSVLKATHSTAFINLLRRFMALERAGEIFGELQYNQILQAVLLAQFEARGGRVSWRPEVDLPEDVVDKALTAWSSQQAATQLSGFHLDVSQALNRLGIQHQIEYLVARDLLSIDIAVIKDGCRIAIEVDGPFHFPINARTPLGHTMIRRRLLRAAGWSVVSIPWYEWFAMNTWEARLRYLAAVLGKADAKLGEKLRHTTDLLSTEYEPGPGVDSTVPTVSPETAASLVEAGEVESDQPRVTSSGSFDDGEDGPALLTDDERYADKEVLREVLFRGNCILTSGAVRRLTAMGLGKEVKMLRDSQAHGRATGSNRRQRGGPSVRPVKFSNDREQSSSSSSGSPRPISYDEANTNEPLVAKSILENTDDRNSVDDGDLDTMMPGDTNNNDDASTLMPKPVFKGRRMRKNEVSPRHVRFTPLFTDSTVQPARKGDVAWGVQVNQLDAWFEMQNYDSNKDNPQKKQPLYPDQRRAQRNRPTRPASSVSSIIEGGSVSLTESADAVLDRALHGRRLPPNGSGSVGTPASYIDGTNNTSDMQEGFIEDEMEVYSDEGETDVDLDE